MKLTIQIDSDNAACLERHDVIEIVQKALPRMYTADTLESVPLKDVTGNTVGFFQFQDEDSED